MNRKKMADRSEVSIATLRYYEELGLITPSRNKSNGYREYCPVDEIKLAIILRFKDFGLTLKEIRIFFDLLKESKDNTGRFKAFLQQKQDDIDKQIQGLLKTKEALQKFKNRKDVETCAIYSKLLDQA